MSFPAALLMGSAPRCGDLPPRQLPDPMPLWEEAFRPMARAWKWAAPVCPYSAGLNRSLQLLEAEGEAQQRLERIPVLAGRLWQELGTPPGVQPLLKVPPSAGLESFTVAGPHRRQ